MQTQVEKQLEIHFMYLGNKDIYCNLKTCCILLFYFIPHAVYFTILSFSVQTILTFS